ncbi:MAG: DUF1614 domain-containing protein [Methanomicrobiales archaeon]|nr:DUF1614 domain-containing protein [Methanomicrobiales archaeon]
MPRYLFNPFTILMLVILTAIVLLLLPLLFLSLIGTAFLKLGFSWREILILFFFIFLGSFINIPVTTLRGAPVTIRVDEFPFFGRFYQFQEYTPSTTVSINVGGAVIPVLISLILLYDAAMMLGNVSIIILSLAGSGVVTIIVHHVARPVPGLGIVTPFFVPPASALLCGLILSSWTSDPLAAAIIAYVSGTLGTLIGADLLNLHRIREIGTPMVSIGGAGTFDGIFLSGIIAALLA